ncbi:MAG: lipopolysaccharide biosynthesis protein [Cyclobacteriaceae bacterium]
MSLKQRALGGLAWNFAQKIALQGINFLVSILLARILLPEEFGLIGMIAIFGTIGTSLMDSGMTSSLIRSANPTQADYSTVFYINLLGSGVVYVILYICAPFISKFFNEPILTEVVRVYFIALIIRAFSMIQSTRLTKKMDFKTQMTISIPSLLVGGGAGVLMAYKGFGVWSLVWMYIIQTLFETIQLWIRTSWTPSIMFDKSKFKLHFDFGYKLTISGLINTLFANIYNIIIGRYFSSAQLGFYSMAQTLKQIPVANLSSVLNQVTYPLFAEVQNDSDRLRVIYKRLMCQVMFWITPTLIVAGVLAEPFFRVVLTDKWLPSVPYFQILCIVGIMYPLQSYNLNILKVKGRSDLFLRLEVIKKIFVTMVIMFSVGFGIYGLLWGQVFITIGAFFINSFYSGVFIGYKVSDQLLDILPILGLGCLTGVLCYFSNELLKDSFEDFTRLTSLSFLSAIVYLGAAHVTNSSPLGDFKQLLLKK